MLESRKCFTLHLFLLYTNLVYMSGHFIAKSHMEWETNSGIYSTPNVFNIHQKIFQKAQALFNSLQVIGAHFAL